MSMNVDTSGNKAPGKGEKTEKVSFKVPEKTSTNDDISKPSRTRGINKAIVTVLFRSQ
jgi:hypothetical protein